MKSIANFGKRIRVLRARQGLTQAAFAQRLGVTPSYLNLVEHDRRPVSANLLIRLAQITDLDLKSLAAGEDTQLIAALMEAFGDPVFEGSAAREAALEDEDLFGALAGYLERRHKVAVRVMKAGEMDTAMRRYDPEKRELSLS